jgi:hypothetical protein
MAPAPSSESYGIGHGVEDVANGLLRRDLQNPTHTQQVTLGIIAVYVVVIAILWNVPYVRMVLWPFKVRFVYGY